MGFPYPHYGGELLAGAVASGLLLGPCLWAYQHLPRWAGLPVLCFPLALLLATCVWVGVRARRG